MTGLRMIPEDWEAVASQSTASPRLRRIQLGGRLARGHRDGGAWPRRRAPARGVRRPPGWSSRRCRRRGPTCPVGTSPDTAATVAAYPPSTSDGADAQGDRDPPPHRAWLSGAVGGEVHGPMVGRRRPGAPAGQVDPGLGTTDRTSRPAGGRPRPGRAPAVTAPIRMSWSPARTTCSVRSSSAARPSVSSRQPLLAAVGGHAVELPFERSAAGREPSGGRRLALGEERDRPGVRRPGRPRGSGSRAPRTRAPAGGPGTPT